jgi:hypothetical protein
MCVCDVCVCVCACVCVCDCAGMMASGCMNFAAMSYILDLLMNRNKDPFEEAIRCTHTHTHPSPPNTRLLARARARTHMHTGMMASGCMNFGAAICRTWCT